MSREVFIDYMLGNKTEGLAHVIHKNITSQYTNEEFTKKNPGLLKC